MYKIKVVIKTSLFIKQAVGYRYLFMQTDVCMKKSVTVLKAQTAAQRKFIWIQSFVKKILIKRYTYMHVMK